VSDSDPALDAFRRIYASDHWQGGSGAGSHVAATEAYRRILEAVVRGRDITTVVDAGCGDWQFSRLVDWSDKRYVGVDIVPEVVVRDREAFGRENVEFVVDDIRTAALPAADLLVCKDVLQHWDVGSVQAFLDRNLARYRYALVTNDIASVHSGAEMLNAEIPIGHWRPLDLERSPFGRRAQAQIDFDIRGEWTKRCLLFIRRGSRSTAAIRRSSAYRAFRRARPTTAV
jgi:SAM-dependent methyltransferase